MGSKGDAATITASQPMLIVLLPDGNPAVVEMQLLSETRILWEEK